MSLFKELVPYLLMLRFDNEHSSPVWIERVIQCDDGSPIVIRVEYTSPRWVKVKVKSKRVAVPVTEHNTNTLDDAIDHVKKRIKQWEKNT